MRGCGDNALQRGKALYHEQGYLLIALAVQHKGKVVPAAHQHHAVHFLKVRNGLGYLVKAAFAPGRHAQLDNGLHAGHARLLPIHQGVITVDDMVFGIFVQLARHGFRRVACDAGDILHAHAGVFFQKLQYLLHTVFPLSLCPSGAPSAAPAGPFPNIIGHAGGKVNAALRCARQNFTRAGLSLQRLFWYTFEGLLLPGRAGRLEKG